MNPLKDELLRLIRAEGPISVAQYMHIALEHPEHGYYMQGDPLGGAGDFITAPEVSQAFGELIGLFFVQAWEDRGQPKRFHLVELGPGRGTLMADMLRAAKLRPAFLKAAQVTLIETSPALRAVQARTLDEFAVSWADNLDAVARDAPLFLVANEFLDALPCHQFIKSEQGWHERVVAAEGGSLVFAQSKETLPTSVVPAALASAQAGAIIEIGVQALSIVSEVAQRIVAGGGAALFADYGPTESGLGDTFQAVKAHHFADPLEEPGEADLTFHVDFGQMRRAAEKEGALVYGPVTQGAFLEVIGIRERAEALKQAAPDYAEEIEAGIARLIDADEMGTLFKVIALTTPGTPLLPGF